ncbi:YugN family protein [Oceanobacillus halotolerans]|uniref:YugN family protein n=1 Tax=Oceanobacillus halotolerans TaxID=2663380 RepID=UPI0013D8FC84|nr:YugN family protein [Oceanobacillus halotolerans]
MRLENTGLEGVSVDIKPLDRVMGQHAFILGEHWDYDRVTYDYRIGSQEKNITYYIRIQGEAVEGDVDKKNAVIQLKTPLLGKHYYPHGVEYGEEENFPENLIERANKLISKLKEELKQYQK